MGSEQKTCGNCHTIQPFNETHVTCLNDKCRSCGCLVGKNHAGCKHYTPMEVQK